MIPVELAEVGRRYRYEWAGGTVHVGTLKRINPVPDEPGNLWCMFNDDGDHPGSLHGCAMSDVIEEL